MMEFSVHSFSVITYQLSISTFYVSRYDIEGETYIFTVKTKKN